MLSTPQASVAAITAVAIAISEGKSKRELIYIAEMFSQLSHTLRTIAISTIDLEIPDPKKD